MLRGRPAEAAPLAQRAVDVAQQAEADAEHAHGLATLGILQAERGQLGPGLTALRRSFELARGTGSVEGVIRAATNRMYLLIRAGRFGEALEVARAGQQAAASLGVPPALTSALDNNTAWVLIATGHWAEADQLLAGLVAESPANVTRYLQLLQLELAVGKGDAERTAELAAVLAADDEPPRLTGPLHACLAEQACSRGDLAAAADEVLAGLASVQGAGLPEEEIRLLATGARISADLAPLPGPLRPGDLGEFRTALAASFAARAALIAGQHPQRPEVTAFARVTVAEQARQQGSDTPALWRGAADAWQAAGQPYREAYARLREAAAAAAAGSRDQARRALAAGRSLASQLPSAPLMGMAGELAGRARLTDPSGPVGSVSASARFCLTNREMQVLPLLAQGYSNRQIARRLVISDRTVAVHVSRILSKLGVRNRAEAAATSTRLGLTSLAVPRNPRNEVPD
jgi:ATP/maltotriose-dependent transcriptional regulator MalT